MEIIVSRFVKNAQATIGRLNVDGRFECYTLEDVVCLRGTPKVAGPKAIPAGTYAVALTFSTRFHEVMPQLLQVPGYEAIRLHAGNTAADTAGSLLLGTAVAPTGQRVFNSWRAYHALLLKLEAAVGRQEAISLHIE
ncbi:hypothetical protein GCM10027422_43590 [Hymenobacter arcticus]